MATPARGPPIQDVAPKGGYPAIKIARNLPNRGPPGWAMFAGMGAVMFTGLFILGRTNERRRQLKAEKRRARIALVPLLQSELDMQYATELHRQQQAAAAAVKIGKRAWKFDEGL